MTMQARYEIDLTVQSFAYVARKLACLQGAQYEHILDEAEKHRRALRLMQRDVFEMAERGLRERTLTAAECHRLRETAKQTIAQAEQAIAGIAAQYAPHRLAA